MSSAQLLISHVRKGSNYTFETYSNTHAIDVDEHKFGKQGVVCIKYGLQRLVL